MEKTVPGGAPSRTKGFCASEPEATSPDTRISIQSLLTGTSTALTKASTPFSVMFPSSQNAPLIFLRTSAGLSRKSILELGSEEDILLPVRPGTIGFIRWARFRYPSLGRVASAKVKIFRCTGVKTGTMPLMIHDSPDPLLRTGNRNQDTAHQELVVQGTRVR